MPHPIRRHQLKGGGAVRRQPRLQKKRRKRAERKRRRMRKRRIRAVRMWR